MILAVTNLIINIFGIDAAKARRYALIALAVAAFLVIAIPVMIFRSCGASRTEKKIEGAKTDVTTGKVISNLQANAVNAAANVSNKALENVNAVKRTDSNKYSNSYDGAKLNYCRSVKCEDSLCADLRARGECR